MYILFLYIYIYLFYIYIPLQKENKEITRPNWRCGVGTPGPSTPEAPTSGLETAYPLAARAYFPITLRFPYSPPLCPHFLRLLLFLSGDGSTNASERGQVQIVTRAPGVRTCGQTRIHSRRKPSTRADTRTRAHSQIYAGTKEASCRTYRRPSHCWLISELRGRKAGGERKCETGKRDTVGVRNPGRCTYGRGNSESRLTLERLPLPHHQMDDLCR